MFDYLAVLCDRTAEHVQEGEMADALELLEKQGRFLGEHVASWYGDFRAMAERIVQTRFYRGCLKLASEFVDGEPEEIALLREAIAA